MRRAFAAWRARLPKPVRLWGLPLAGVAALFALGNWGGEAARFLLFRHHLFYLLAVMLLMNPTFETFWPSPERSGGARSPGRYRPARRRHRGSLPRRSVIGPARSPLAVLRLRLFGLRPKEDGPGREMAVVGQQEPTKSKPTGHSEII